MMWRSTRLSLGCNRILFRAEQTCIGIQVKNLSAKPFREMPGSSILANVFKYTYRSMNYFHHDIVEGFEKYGPVYKFLLPGFKMVFVCDPKDIEHVFRNDDSPANRGVDSSFAKYFVSKGMKEGISGADDSWYAHRSTTAPNMLLPRQNKGYVPGLAEIADDSIASLKEGRNTNLLPTLQLWATESVYYVMFGHRAGTNVKTPDRNSLEFIEAVFGAFESETKLTIGFPVHRYIKTPELRRFFRAVDVISKFTFHFMEKIKDSPRSLTDGHECLFEKFKREKKLTNDEITQVAVTLLAGGVDTSSTMLASTLYKLSKSQIAQATLYEEINSVLPNGHAPTFDHLNKMPYLKATINEVFRTNPVTPATVRQLTKPIVLGGYEVPAGVTIALSSGYMSTQMKKQVFGDLDNFRPERWLRGNKDFHPFASLPFGFGPRMCVGRRIAQMEISLFLVRFLQKFKLEESSLPEDQLGWIFGQVQRPDKPVNFCLTAR